MRNPVASSPVALRHRFDVGFPGRALRGLTPQLLAFVAILLLCRTVGTSAGSLVASIETGELADWIRQRAEAYTSLIRQVAPMLIIVLATANLGPQRGWRRGVALAIAVIVSAALGTFLRAPHLILRDAHSASGFVFYVWPRYALLGGLLTAAGELYRSQAESNAAAQRMELERVGFENDMTAARLQMLQAQIEPHFLFNTLANARRLYVEEHATGRTMLESLMRYLQIALPEMRHGATTLERDAELVHAYLKIQQLRMGERLTFDIDIPPALLGCSVPPMMLLTLAENAIKHGLNPLPHGGQIRISARREEDRLLLTVADTGTGFRSASGSGIGLANISARLAAEFGQSAGLTLANNEFGGATAVIALPCHSMQSPDELEQVPR